MRMIDADKMLSELKPITYEMKQNAVTIADMSNIMRNWVCRQPTAPAYGQWESVEDNPPGNEYDFVLAYKPYLHEMGRSGIIVEHPWFVRMNKTYKYWMPLPEPPEERYKCHYADDNGVCSKCSKNGEIIYCVEGPCPYMFDEVRDDEAHIEP